MDKHHKRSANFIQAEVELLCDLVARYINIIENRRSDAGIWKEKEEHWQKIENEFNSRSLSVYRSAKTLKLKYEAIKKNIKRKSVKGQSEVYDIESGSADASSYHAEGGSFAASPYHAESRSVASPNNTENGSVAPPALSPQEVKVKGMMFSNMDELNIDFDSDVLPDSSRGSRFSEIVEGRLEVLNLQKKIAHYELLMKEEEERQSVLRWAHDARQRERDEKIKDMELEIKRIQLERLKAET